MLHLKWGPHAMLEVALQTFKELLEGDAEADKLLQLLLRMCEQREVQIRHHRACIAAEAAKAEARDSTKAAENMHGRLQVPWTTPRHIASFSSQCIDGFMRSVPPWSYPFW